MTVAAPLVRALVEVVERAGVKRRTYLAAARLGERELADETRRFELTDLDRFYSLAMDLTGLETLGLDLAEHASEAAFDVIGQLVTHAPTLRSGLSLLAQYGPVMLSDSAMAVSESGGKARIVTRSGRMSARGLRFQRDLAMAGMLRLARFYVSPLARPSAVYFEHAPPRDTREYEQRFGKCVTFGHEFTALEFPRAWLERPVRHRSDRLYTLVLDEARRRLASLDAGWSYGARVERYVLSFPPASIPSMEMAARELGTSPRSLRRHLKSEGTSYRAFVKAALERAAREALRNPMHSVEDAARTAGFSDSSSFNRAFKRWTGITPAAFRRTAP